MADTNGKRFAWDASAYSKASGIQKKWGLELLDKLRLRGDERALDIGCGDGKLSLEIALRVPEGSVVGIDSSQEMIAFARDKYPAERHLNLSWQVMDVRELGFDEEFNVVFSNAVMHWVLDHLVVLKGIRRALRPGGRVLLQMGGRGNVSDMGRILAELIALDSWLPYFTNFTFPFGFYGPEEYRGWLEEAGLKALRLELISKDMAFESKKALASWVRTTWMPFTERVPEEMREVFIGEIVDHFGECHPAGADGLLHLEATRLEVEAERPI